MHPKIVFLGTPKFAADILDNIANTPHKPTLVITGHPKPSGRSQALKPTAVELVAKKHGIEISYELSSIDKTFDVAILTAYGKIIPDNYLGFPKFGFVNVHPSLLPKYRGPSPIQSAILAGDDFTGVTLIVLDNELDHGPQIAQQEVETTETETYESLQEKLAKVGAQLLLKTLPEYLKENITPQPQNHEAASYTKKITKESGKIDFNNPPNKGELNRIIRAYYPWPSVWTEINGKRFKLLPEGKIQPEGKKPLTQKEFANGYPKTAGLFGKIIDQSAVN